MSPNNLRLTCWVFAIAFAVVAEPADSSYSLSKWKLQSGDISEYRVLRVLKRYSKIDCLSSSDAAEAAHAVSFSSESGDCTLLVCNRGSKDACRKCRHEGDPGLAKLWFKEPLSCWTTFQHRVDGSVSFNRNWGDYVNGFGQGERLNYWMGLEQLHQLTATGVWRVRWEFSDWNGTWYWAENAPFSVGPGTDKYRCSMGPLDVSRSSVGQRTEAEYLPNNQQFSTPEYDNDLKITGSCAAEKSAGWWYGYCAAINPNGVYKMYSDTKEDAIYYYLYDSGTVLTLNVTMKNFELLIFKE